MADVTVCHDGPIVTREEARAAGLKRFFVLTPCRNNHVAERYVSTGGCCVCNKIGNDRFNARNPDKNAVYTATYRARNPERVRAASLSRYYARYDEYRAYRMYRYRESKEVRDAKLEYGRAYREGNPEKMRAFRKRWRIANLDVVSALSRQRRGRQRGNGGAHTAKQIADLLVKQKRKCVNCLCSIEKKYHVDHIVPVARGGSNDISNIQLLCPTCNHRKSAKDPFAWAREHGRLL